MSTLAPPVARCPTCGGWLTRRALYPTERPTIALVCGLCAWDGEIIAGALVPITRPAGSPPLRALAPVDKSGWRGPGRPRREQGQ